MAHLRRINGGVNGKVINRAGPTSNGPFVREEWITLAASIDEAWFVVQRPYRLTQLDRSLTSGRSLERHPDWWTEDREFPLGKPHRTPPHPQLRTAAVDAEGLLWVYILTEADTWRNAWTDVPAGAYEIPSRLIRLTSVIHQNTVDV